MRLLKNLLPCAALLMSGLVLSACGGSGAAVTAASTTPPASVPPTSEQDALEFGASSYTAAQAAGTITLTVTRSSGTGNAVTVNYASSNGTAAAGSNYTAATGSLSWAAGDASSRNITVALSATAFTGTKTFTMTLSAASGATVAAPSVTVSITGSGTGGSSPPPEQDALAFSASSYTVAQPAASIKLTVTRSSGAANAVTVNYATTNGTATAGSNYTASSGKLTWAAGDATSRDITVALSATAFTGTKSFTVTLSGATGASVAAPAVTVSITGSGSSGTAGGAGPAAKLAAKLGLPSRLLLGVGEQGSVDPITAVKSQGIKIDIYTRYLGGGDWTTWNSPPCDYVCVVGNAAASVGAIPMYTYYQMANNGDGNLTVLTDSSFMATYWARVKILYQDIAALKTAALVHFEPDFWGYTERAATNGDPAQLAAVVTANPDCATLSNDVKGVVGCIIAMARKYAPNAYVGFSPSDWGGNSNAEVVAWMNAVGAQAADFIVEQTLDRDVGCFEVMPQPTYCARGGNSYWDETNATHPNFQDHLAEVQAYHTGIGNLPVVWWQTPLGVPSNTPGGSDFHYRDNRVHYFLSHPSQLTAVGGLAVLFSTGEGHQTNITTDSGQFQSLSGSYLASPTALP
jgi:Calx-beta domain